MARITITENDETSNELGLGSFDIAYVPGFGSKTDTYYRKPKIFTSLSAFTGAMGTAPVKFTTNYQMTSSAWNSAAIDTSVDGYMFTAGDADPGYVYAYTLLQNNMAVCYEQINRVTADTKTTIKLIQASGWTSHIEEAASPTEDDYFTATITVTPDTNWEVNAEALTSVHMLGTALTDVEVSAATEASEDDIIITLTLKYSEQLKLAGIIVVTEESSTKTYSIAFDCQTVVPWINSSVIDAYDPAVMYTALSSTETHTSILDKLCDRSTYRIKFLTTGGYPVFENTLGIIGAMTRVVAAVESVEDGNDNAGRGDCVALIDHTNVPSRPLIGTGSVFEALQSANWATEATTGQFCAMFTPWKEYTTSLSGVSTIAMPASFAYMKTYAADLANYNSFEAVAGVKRGAVTGIKNNLTDDVLTKTIANRYNMSPDKTDPDTDFVSMNAITNVYPYGDVIWGNMTAARVTTELKAGYYLNTRNMVSDIKKAVYDACNRFMFDQNSEKLWINFKAAITPTLELFKGGDGIKDYSISKDSTKSTHTSLYAVITIQPIYAVDDINITVTLTDEDISVSES